MGILVQMFCRHFHFLLSGALFSMYVLLLFFFLECLTVVSVSGNMGAGCHLAVAGRYIMSVLVMIALWETCAFFLPASAMID